MGLHSVVFRLALSPQGESRYKAGQFYYHFAFLLTVFHSLGLAFAVSSASEPFCCEMPHQLSRHSEVTSSGYTHYDSCSLFSLFKMLNFSQSTVVGKIGLELLEHISKWLLQ